MATEEPQAPEGFEEVTRPTTDDESDTIDLESGETLQGPVYNIEEGEGKYGAWFRLTIDDEQRGVKDYFAKDEVKTACKSGKIERGTVVWIARGTEEVPIGDEGDTYIPTKCRVQTEN